MLILVPNHVHIARRVDWASEHTQQRLPQVRMCVRVRDVSPECSTWLNLGSWGWGRLHSNVGHPRFPGL